MQLFAKYSVPAGLFLVRMQGRIASVLYMMGLYKSAINYFFIIITNATTTTNTTTATGLRNRSAVLQKEREKPIYWYAMN